MDSCEPPTFLLCNFCNNYIISERTKCDNDGNFYHQKCFELHNEIKTK